MVIGPTRCGKTATILKPLIWKILKTKKQGEINVGLSVCEPKGDLAEFVKDVCDELDIDCCHIDPTNPNTDTINVMAGNKTDVAESTVTVLKSLFGKQESFFATVQEMSGRKITLLLKELYGDDVFLIDVLNNLQDEKLLMRNVDLLENKGTDDELVNYFRNELLSGDSKERYRQFVMGLRALIENITSNEHLKPIITKQSSIDLDAHFEKGGVLAVNTALGLTGKAGDAFGQFIAMHLQLATFRRPGTERTRVPHYMIIDEFSRYINPDIERFLSIAAEYRVAGIFAIQSLGQLEVESGETSGRAMKQAILTSCRNKIIFCGVSGQDAKELSLELGEDTVIERDRTFDGGILKQFHARIYKDVEREKQRFPYTLLMDGLPRFHFVHKLLQGGVPQKPGIAVGGFVPYDWREQLQHKMNPSEDVPIEKKPSIFNIKERLMNRLKSVKVDIQSDIEGPKNKELNPNKEANLDDSSTLNTDSNHEKGIDSMVSTSTIRFHRSKMGGIDKKPKDLATKQSSSTQTFNLNKASKSKVIEKNKQKDGIHQQETMTNTQSESKKSKRILQARQESKKINTTPELEATDETVSDLKFW